MNVLFVLPYCYIPEINKKPSTGFGIYTIQLAEEIAKKHNINVYVLCMKQNIRHNLSINGVLYIGFPEAEICLNAFKKQNVNCAVNICKYSHGKQPLLKKILKAIYTASKSSMLGKVVKKYSIDFIHIHSLETELYGIFSSPYITDSNTLVTIHSDFVKGGKFGAYSDFFKNTTERLFKDGIHVSFVSTGAKDHFANEIQEPNARLHVILNGTIIEGQEYNRDYSDDIFRIVCIGSIGRRKNQIFLIEVLNQMPRDLLRKVHFQFLGMDTTQGDFDRRIQEYGLTEVCENCGFVAPEDVKTYLINADGTIMVSVQEAFGISVIEGFQYGLPTLTYSDLAASSDFYSEDAVMFIKDRSKSTLADAIMAFASKEWDRKKIRAWGKRFKINNIADEYVDLYRKILGEI